MFELIKIKTENLSFSYNGNRILDNVSLEFREKTITAIVGPSGIGKSTFLLTLNRLWETVPQSSMSGRVKIRFDGKMQDIYGNGMSLTGLRRKVGMVFQAPNPLPMSIFKNIAFPLKLAGIKDRRTIDENVERALQQAGLWMEVKDRLNDSGLHLSGGQQQRLCIARALVLQPEVLLLDEPTSSLDDASAAVIEELLVNLKDNCTLIVVSHYFDQVKRIADTVFQFPYNGISQQ